MRAPLAIVALTSACLAAVRVGDAAEWSAAPTLGWTVDHDSNRALEARNEEPSQGGYVDLDLALKRATPSSALSLRPHLTLQRYTGDTVSDADDRSVQAAGAWRTPRNLYSAQIGIAELSTLDNALIDAEIVGVDTRRRSKSASLSWTHDQSKDRNQLSASLSYLDVDYPGSEIYRLSGYRYPSASITQTIGWTPRTSLQLTAYGSRLDSDSDSRSSTVGAQLGFSYDISPRLNLAMSGGYSRQTIQQPFFFGLFILKTRDSGYTGDVGLTRRDALGQWRLFATRSVTASGFGALVMRTEAGASFERHFAPRWTLSCALRHIGNNDIGELYSGEVHTYQRFDVGVSWSPGRTWTLRAQATARRIEREIDSPFADSWRVMLAAIWVPQARVLSR